MKAASLLSLCFTFALLHAPSAAWAQLYNVPTRANTGSVGGGNSDTGRNSQATELGGGFIELVATGPLTGSSRPETASMLQGAASGEAYGVPPFGPAPQRARALAYAPLAAETYAHPRPVLSEPEAEFRRQEVEYHGEEAPGTVIIDTPEKFLFLVEPGGRALRYGIGVGRPGFEWAGIKTITRKAEWPGWTPPSEMLKRRPDLPPHMDGGLGNPLGARALYLGSTLYRIHGTNEPETIGKAVSSGCIRMLNDDVVDLYGRVRIGTRVVVM
ncbi:MAG: L,D-transpeptidase [Hyphomicrobiales bacterium]|nr:L,D-transpeptidase [Hyphomicrobiales bacterium]MBV8770366.1 L,D-transpeptidase [Hyphomicrobiales bacterium]MBV9054119.1 L,D-transpeptidase [Hyphomicrobiales bacterium]MBV9135741.1 L,D-transpeptidase [Hyphomicrobiales bacterium]MBV9975288.1 L,D-transpeptidase [Hyphomicrobiales bacterium]